MLQRQKWLTLAYLLSFIVCLLQCQGGCLTELCYIVIVCLLQCQGGCLTELCIQLAIVFVGKQVISNLIEVFLPYVFTYSVCTSK